MKENYTDSLTNVWLEQVDLVQADLTYKTLMAKLKNFSGADMTKEYNDVYGKTDLDYANEFNEFDAEAQYVKPMEEDYSDSDLGLADPHTGYRYELDDIPGHKG